MKLKFYSTTLNLPLFIVLIASCIPVESNALEKSCAVAARIKMREVRNSSRFTSADKAKEVSFKKKGEPTSVQMHGDDTDASFETTNDGHYLLYAPENNVYGRIALNLQTGRETTLANGRVSYEPQVKLYSSKKVSSLGAASLADSFEIVNLKTRKTQTIEVPDEIRQKIKISTLIPHLFQYEDGTLGLVTEYSVESQTEAPQTLVYNFKTREFDVLDLPQSFPRIFRSEDGNVYSFGLTKDEKEFVVCDIRNGGKIIASMNVPKDLKTKRLGKPSLFVAPNSDMVGAFVHSKGLAILNLTKNTVIDNDGGPSLEIVDKRSFVRDNAGAVYLAYTKPVGGGTKTKLFLADTSNGQSFPIVLPAHISVWNVVKKTAGNKTLIVGLQDKVKPLNRHFKDVWSKGIFVLDIKSGKTSTVELNKSYEDKRYNNFIGSAEAQDGYVYAYFEYVNGPDDNETVTHTIVPVRIF